MTDPTRPDPLAPEPSYGGPPPMQPGVPQYQEPGAPYGTNPYEATPYDTNQYGTTPYGANQYGANQYGQYGTTPYPGNPYGLAPHNYYPPGYGQGYPQAPADRRPGTLTAAAVLGYVNGGLLILAAVFVFFGASIVHDLISTFGGDDNYTAEFVIAGLVNLVAAGLQIGGGVSMSGRNTQGRLLYTVGTGLTVAAALYWVLRWAVQYDGVHGLIVYAVLFTALAVVGTSLAFTGADNRWLSGKSA